MALYDWRTTNDTNMQLKEEDGCKADGGKLRVDLIPVSAIRSIATVLTYGADKYGDRNWEKGLSWSRVYAAAQRHLLAWFAGDDVDNESKLSHLDHALTNIAFLTHYSLYNKAYDDRPQYNMKGVQQHGKSASNGTRESRDEVGVRASTTGDVPVGDPGGDSGIQERGKSGRISYDPPESRPGARKRWGPGVCE